MKIKRKKKKFILTIKIVILKLFFYKVKNIFLYYKIIHVNYFYYNIYYNIILYIKYNNIYIDN